MVAKADGKDAPESAVDGALLYVSNGCSDCHELNGKGGETGPELNGLADRRKREWVEQHFADPAKFSLGSIMPPYDFNAQDRERITSYLMAIPKE